MGRESVPSPEWLRRRLEAVGVRSINNVVDATNWVMLELNQPMHAYDAAKLHWGRLIVRRAIAGERVVTLDDVERKLTAEMVAIADPRGGHRHRRRDGWAGTEVSNETRDVLLEGAYWDPARTRRTRRTLGLSTEASYRFERGIDRWGGADAMRRCLEIVLATAGGELIGRTGRSLAVSDQSAAHLPSTRTRRPRCSASSCRGTTVEQHLVAIGATVVSKPEDGRIAVDVPGWRPDLQREIDLVEEIARLHGYDAFPSELRHFRAGIAARCARRGGGLVRPAGHGGQGLHEVVSLPFGPAEGDESVRLLNPLSAEDAYLRRGCSPVWSGWSSATGRTTSPTSGSSRSAPCSRRPPRASVQSKSGGWPRCSPAAGSPPLDRPEPPLDMWDLKGRLEAAVALAIPGAAIQVEGNAWIVRDRAAQGAHPRPLDPLHRQPVPLDPGRSSRSLQPVSRHPESPDRPRLPVCP